ncbi:MAG: hypothetical protein K6E53_12940 [Lachnospiraceae bacterium]|nr:hypothetical protein [Lachnospiraceae bacterium]
MSVKTSLETDFSRSIQIFFEHNICFNGYTYLLIFGKHINGGFICIPNWKIGCEASTFAHSSGYNADKMEAAGLDRNTAEALAEYIDNYMLSKGFD